MNIVITFDPERFAHNKQARNMWFVTMNASFAKSKRSFLWDPSALIRNYSLHEALTDYLEDCDWE